MKAKILIDSISLLSPLSGVGRYNYEVAKELKKSNKYDFSYFYSYHSKNLVEVDSSLGVKNFKSILLKSSFIKKVLRKILSVLQKMSFKKYDIYWQPNFIPLNNINSKKTISSVHDFSFVLHKDYHPKERIEYFEKNFYKNIYLSDCIITFSNYHYDSFID